VSVDKALTGALVWVMGQYKRELQQTSTTLRRVFYRCALGYAGRAAVPGIDLGKGDGRPAAATGGGTHSRTAVPLTLHRHLIHKDAIHGPIPLLVGSNLLLHNLQQQKRPFSLQEYAWWWLGERRLYSNMHMQLVAGGTSTMGGLQ
jgi:hypothetical protein